MDNIATLVPFPDKISRGGRHTANRVCHTIASKGIQPTKRSSSPFLPFFLRDCIPPLPPLPPSIERDHPDERDGFLRRALLCGRILSIHPLSLLSNWEIPDGSVSSSYAVLYGGTRATALLFTASSSSFCPSPLLFMLRA